MAVTSLGIEFPTGGTVLWADIDEISTFYLGGRLKGTKVIGLRLNNYGRYLRSMTPAEAAAAANWLKGMKIIAASFAVAKVMDFDLGSLREGIALRSLRDTLKTIGDLTDVLELLEVADPRIVTLASTMGWSREKYGFDLCLSPSTLDRSAEEFVTLLQRRHAQRMA